MRKDAILESADEMLVDESMNDDWMDMNELGIHTATLKKGQHASRKH